MKICPEHLNEWHITQNKVYRQWLASNVVCCQMTSYFEKQKCLNKRRRIDAWSLIEIEHTLNVHPLTQVTYPRTLKYKGFVDWGKRLAVLYNHCIAPRCHISPSRLFEPIHTGNNLYNLLNVSILYMLLPWDLEKTFLMLQASWNPWVATW